MIKCSGGFVGEDEAGLIDQCTHHGDPLAFAAGELGWAVGEPVAKPDTIEQLFRALDCAGRRLTVFCERRHEHVFQNRALREQVVRLKNEADFLVSDRGQVLLGQVGEFLSVELNAAVGRGVE